MSNANIICVFMVACVGYFVVGAMDFIVIWGVFWIEFCCRPLNYRCFLVDILCEFA